MLLIMETFQAVHIVAPEIASVGLTEKQAKEKGYDIKVGKFPFSASGKASAGGTKDGFCKSYFRC